MILGKERNDSLGKKKKRERSESELMWPLTVTERLRQRL